MELWPHSIFGWRTTVTETATLPTGNDTSPQPTMRQVLTAGAIGNVLEWFDFAIYGYLAQYIASEFFPTTDPLSSLLAVYGAFAAGYLARPLGGMAFGHIGDTLGRKYVLTLSITLMGISTVGIGLLPTYDQIGPAAGVLLVIFRVLQGVSVGGEFTGSIVFIAEQAPRRRRGIYASVSMCGCMAGFLLGSGLTTVLSNLFTDAQMADGIWRIAFLSGIIIMAAGVLLRRSLNVTEEIGASEQGQEETPPLVKAIRYHWADILRVAGLALSTNVGFYIMFVFAVTYLTEQMHISTAEAMDINTFALVLIMLIVPLGGWLSDVVGRRKVLLTFNMLLLVLCYPLFWAIHHQAAWMIVLGQAGFALVIGVLFGCNPGTMTEIAPRSVRISVISIGYNVALATFGGTAPAVATYLIQRTSDDMAPAFYMMIFALAAIVAVLSIPAGTLNKPAPKDQEVSA
ncbi:MHS family MFS transporter [Labrenzia sp. PHM005]|nr:MHS family MFS transporter [Labrenzia sp. PHM005]